MKKIIFGFGLFLVLVGAVIFIILVQYSYDEFLELAMSFANVPESKKMKLSGLLTSGLFNLLRFSPLTLSVVGIAITYYSNQIILFLNKIIGCACNTAKAASTSR